MPRLLAAFFLLTGCIGAPGKGQRVDLTVVAGEQVNPISVTLETRWLGEHKQVALTQSQETYKAHLEGDLTRLLPITIWIEQEGHSQPYIAYQGIEVLSVGTSHLSWALELPQRQSGPRGELKAHRTSSPRTTRALKRWEKTQLTAGFAWLGSLLLLGLWILKQPRTTSRLDPLFRWWFSPVVWMLLALAWTWPALLAGEHIGVGRHFDALGTIWTIDASSRLLQSFIDPLTAWPAGANYQALDSYLLLPISWALGWMHPVKIHGLLQVMGLVFSAWAAEGFARAIGARQPFSLLAGISFAFSGLAANALLEGHAYQVVNPWLPMFAWAWWLATSRNGRVVHGLYAAAALGACLATTGYMGATAILIGFGFLVGGLVRNGTTIARPALTGIWASVPLIGAYAWWLGAPDPGRIAVAASEGAAKASTNLTNLVAVSQEIDRADHSLAPFIGGIVLATMILAPRALGHKERWRTLAAVSLLALALSFGNSLGVSPESSWFPMPLAILEGTGTGERLRFPVRLLWAWYLCGGALAARVATAMADRYGRCATLLIVAALIEAFVIVRLPFRQVTYPAGIPTAYSTAQGAVLDFFPTPIDDSGEIDRWFSAIACYYQVDHQNPIVDHCATVPEGTNRRVQTNRWLAAALSSGEIDDAKQALSRLGFSNIAFHTDLFSQTQRTVLEAALQSLGTPVSTAIDGGEHIQLYRLAEPKRAPESDLEILGASLQVHLAYPAEVTPTSIRLLGPGDILLGESTLQPAAPLPGRTDGNMRWGSAHWLVSSWPEGPLTLELASESTTLAKSSLVPHEDHLYQAMLFDGREVTRLGPYQSAGSPIRNPTIGSVTAAGWAALLLLTIGWGVGRQSKPKPS